MKKYETGKIRNLALVGHSGSGKTSVTEAMLYKTGITNRLGRVEDGNTVSDFDKEEINRGVSIGMSVVPVEWNDTKINLIDAPGYFDFEGEVMGALRASEAALLVMDASAGIEVGAQKYWNYCEKIGLPRIIFLNKVDKDTSNFVKLVADLHVEFGKKITPLTLPLGEGNEFKGIIDVVEKRAYQCDGFSCKEVEIPEIRKLEVDEVYNQLEEAVALTNDDLMEKYFNGEPFTDEEFRDGITVGMLNGSVVPLIAGSATVGTGIDLLMDCIVKYMPAPDDERANIGFRVLEGQARKVDVNEALSAVVFKTIVDPFLGKISIFKVVSGKITKDTEIYNSTKDKTEKAAGLFYLRGKTQLEATEVVAGDIAAFAKLDLTQTGDTISDKANKIVYKKIKYPQAALKFAIEPRTKNDEDKIGHALNKLSEEDPTFSSDRNPETKQLTIAGLGNVQLQIMLDKLEHAYGVKTNIVPLRIPYRETIKGKSDVQGRHKKQSGGAGQFGDVFIRFEPIEDGFVFAEEVFGGAVPKNYFPAVEKGLEESMEKGVLAGYPVVGIKATLYDGSYHPVDSNEMAFKIAASLAFKKGIEAAQPILLEPVMKVVVNIPEEYMGDVMGDINKKRGRILGMDPQEDGSQQIVAEAPYAELFEYAIDLRSMTQGRGSFTMDFMRYEEVPAMYVDKIIEASKKEEK